MLVRLNMQGYFTKDFNLDACPLVGHTIDYADVHNEKPRRLLGSVTHVYHRIENGQQVVVVACSAREVE